jgi:ParB family chromosome partitioning protein
MSKNRSVLGKGLSALIPGVRDDVNERVREFDRPVRAALVPVESTKNNVTAELELSLIAPNPLQPRKDFDPALLLELTNSIREHGVIQAITVRRVSTGKFEIVSGERRVRASREAGFSRIPAYILGVEDDRTMLELAIIENVQRAQLNPIEEAEAYDKLIRECGLKQEEVAEKISRDRTTISNFLRLLKLPESIKQSLRKGELGMGHAKAIMAISDGAEQESIWEQAVRESLSVRRVEELSRVAAMRTNVTGGDAPKRMGRPSKSSNEERGVESPELTSVENTIKQRFGTQVKIKMRNDGGGEIAMHFYTSDDLERLIEMLLTAKSE